MHSYVEYRNRTSVDVDTIYLRKLPGALEAVPVYAGRWGQDTPLSRAFRMMSVTCSDASRNGFHDFKLISRAAFGSKPFFLVFPFPASLLLSKPGIESLSGTSETDRQYLQ
jgi:hypothetical protein